MEIKKNWFAFFTLFIYEICLLYALFSGITALGGTKEFPGLWYGGAFVAVVLLPVFVYFCAKPFSALGKTGFFSPLKRRNLAAEALAVAALVAAGTAARLYVMDKIKLTPSSDFGTYYQVAELLSKGALSVDGTGLCDYISEFPHVIGFPFLLSLVYRVTGPSVAAGLYLNLAASAVSIFLTYRIARLLCGRTGGLIACAAAAFWPSQILFSSLLASEPTFTCLMLVAVLLGVRMFRYPAEKGKISVLIFESAAMGVVMALAAVVRPMTEILLVAVVLCLVFFRPRLDRAARKSLGVMRRAVMNGFFRAAVVLLGYFLSMQLVNGAVAGTINRTLPGGGVSFGFNLLVGINVKSNGTWNAQDAKLLNDTFAATGSAEAAHRACLAAAEKRFSSDPVGILNLTMEKFASLWGNDDYGEYWNQLFLSQQHKLTPAISGAIGTLTLWGDILYLAALVFCAVGGVFLWRRRRAGSEQMLILFFIGTVVVQMILENQNRYHYNILPLFMILAACGVTELLHRRREHVPPPAMPPAPAPAEKREKREPERFDMLSAIREGHVTVVATGPYARPSDAGDDNPENKTDNPDKPGEKPRNEQSPRPRYRRYGEKPEEKTQDAPDGKKDGPDVSGR